MRDALRVEKKYILWLLFLYTVSQGLILIVSGMWYDDWCIVNISSEGLKMWASEMGRPEVFPIFYAIIALPDFVYKLVIFLAYFIVTICFFMISKRVFSLSSPDAFLLTVLFLAIPANDIRLERLGLPYALGLTLFAVAFFVFLYKYEDLSITYRIISLTLFFLSYILNSLLFFMGLVWLCIVIKEKRVKKILRKIDFIIVPFVYFIIDNIFFPAHGVYQGYNSVTIKKMICAVIGTFKALGDIAGQITSVFFTSFITYPIFWVLIVAVSILSIVLMQKKQDGVYAKENDRNLKRIIIEILIGFLTLFAGVYPYVVVGNGIAISGFDSRNVILIPFGFALILHGIINICIKKECIPAVALISMLIIAVHFNISYMNYQQIYYKDRGLQIYLTQNPEVGELKNIAVVENDGGASWYTYNGMFEEVFGDETRLVENMNYTMTLNPKSYSNCVKREWYNMTECDLSYKKVDCVIVYSNNITPQEAFKTRIHELMGEDISERLISNSSFRIIYPGDDEYTNYIALQ